MVKTIYGATVLPGNITISRVSSSDGPDEMWISIEDESSNIQFVRFKMTLEDFAKALTAQGNVDGTMELFNLERVGWKAENKTERITVPEMDDYKKRRKIALDAVRKLEVDGWSARSGDVENHHCWNGNTVSVVFYRHVKPEEK